ncbi:hypothetical protein EVJ58_g10540, partial [Rhodofomes roseus]
FQGDIDKGICNAWFSKGLIYETEAELAARVRLNARAVSREPLEDDQHHHHHHAHDHDHPHEHAHVHAHDLSDVDMDAVAELVQTRNGAQEALGRDPDTVLDEVMADAGVKDEDKNADDESEDEIKEYIHNTCNGICDIIITGETLLRYGQAWNHYRFYGRVRKWDGLIVLVHVPVEDRGLGTYIFRLPPGSQAAVRDVAEAYRTVPLHPSQWPGTVIRLSKDDDFLVDTVAAFGAAPNGGVYGGIADAGADIMRSKGIGPISKWVDDHTFFRIRREYIDTYNTERQQWRAQVAFHGGEHRERGRRWYGGDVLPDGRIDEFVEDFAFPIRDLSSASPRPIEDARFSSCLADIDAISAELGIPWQTEKDVPFAEIFVFTGFLWDLDARTVAIPRAKADKYRTAIAKWRASRTHVLEEVQKLYGKLLHASMVVTDGRSYLTNLESMLSIFHNNPFMPRTPPRGTMEDIEWWDVALARTDLARPIPGPQSIQRLEAFSDASSGTGIAIVINGHWRAWTLRDGWKRDGRDIAWAEAVGFELLVYCLITFPNLPERARLFGDNNVVVSGWRNGRSRNKQVNTVIRRIHQATAGRGREFFLSYIPSADNPADAPSRGHYPPAAYLLPPVPIPDMVQPFLRDVVLGGPSRGEHAATSNRSQPESSTSSEHHGTDGSADAYDSPADASWFFRAVPNWDE